MNNETIIPGSGKAQGFPLLTDGGRTGNIFNIQHFSIQDGPGIRTTVFLKGCPLHCPWCSNPESILGCMQVKTAPEKCRACGSCIKLCSEGALSLSDGRITLDSTLCSRCMRCIAGCTHGGVTGIGTTVSAGDVIRMIMKDKPFYDHTKGGVTFSGGEPLLQHDYLSAMLEYLHGLGIHIALDTTGYASWDAFRQVLENVDLLLYDIKHLDAAKHRAVTGVDNTPILENLARCSGCTEIWLRVPLIPGFNDDFTFTDSVVELARKVGASRCCFLPFHRWGGHKYARLGMKDTTAGFRDFYPEEMKAFRMRYRSMASLVFFEQA